MNKKILLTLSLALIAIVMASAVSADENVTIDGITFNIPDGYTEDADEAVVNETVSEDGVEYVSNSKLFENGGDIMSIMVATYDESISLDALNDVGDDLKIGDVDGKLLDLSYVKVFSFEKDGKLVVLSTNNQDDIEKFLI